MGFDGSLDLFVDLTAWLNAHPVAHPPGDQNELGEPFRMLPADGGFWVRQLTWEETTTFCHRADIPLPDGKEVSMTSSHIGFGTFHLEDLLPGEEFRRYDGCLAQVCPEQPERTLHAGMQEPLFPDRIHRIDASGPPRAVLARVREAVGL